MSNHCVCCGAPTDTRLCPECRKETLTADHARPDTIKLEKALGRACVLITNHVNAYGTGMDLPMDLLANSRKPEAWKKYFMEDDSR